MTTPNFVTEKESLSAAYGQFIISPLPAGYGHTLGNALRRILLSSIAGAAVTYVRFDGVAHPFATIEGIKESVIEIILNIKLLRFKVVGNGPFTINFSGKGIAKVKGNDFDGGEVEVINGQQHIAEMTTAKAKLEIELTIEKGYGYSPADDRESQELGKIAADATFSPVTKVNFKVEGARVGRRSDFDKLTLDIWTDGTISPEETLKQSALIAADYFGHVLSGRDVKREVVDEKVITQTTADIDFDQKVYQTIIDELDLPTRVINALLREKIETIADLVKRGKEELVGLKGVGRKSVDLIEKELNKLGIPF